MVSYRMVSNALCFSLWYLLSESSLLYWWCLYRFCLIWISFLFWKPLSFCFCFYLDYSITGRSWQLVYKSFCFWKFIFWFVFRLSFTVIKAYQTDVDSLSTNFCLFKSFCYLYGSEQKMRCCNQRKRKTPQHLKWCCGEFSCEIEKRLKRSA